MSAGEVLAGLWRQLRAEVLERVELIERAVRAVAVGAFDEPARVAAKRAAHSLIGAVGTFGFSAASEAARELELELAEPTQARVPSMLSLLVCLRDLPCVVRGPDRPSDGAEA